MVHELKCIRPYFDEVQKRIKNFELRKSDRPFKIGDTLVLKEYVRGEYTGRGTHRKITYILTDCEMFGLKEGYMILGLK